MSTVEILRAARARIADPANWWDGGVSDEGDCSPKVCAWLAFPMVGAEPAEDALARAMGVPTREDIPDFNDSRTHAEVLAAFDRAIANEEAKAQEFTVDVLDAEGVAA